MTGAFEAHFGAPLGSLEELISAKTVTISKLMEIGPAGNGRPHSQPVQHHDVRHGRAAGSGFFANMAVRPVAERHHLKTTHPELAAEPGP